MKLTFIFGFQKIHSHTNSDCFDIVIEKIIVILDNPFSDQRKSGNSYLFQETREFHFDSGGKIREFVPC